MARLRLTRDLRARIAADPYAESLGIETLALRPGYSRMRLVPAPSMVNLCPGRRRVCRCVECAWRQFFEAARAGRALVAEAREDRLGRRAGFYAMTVADEAGRTIATCQGVVHRRPAEHGS